ncbi:MAG: tributyrin esterase [Lachnospiraceae bacterium]|nr:tributyrin esterase [Lachnospiraceae bacterium]
MGFLHVEYMSGELGYQTNLYMVLPDSIREGKEPDGILYLLHGGSGNGFDWMRYSSIERYTWPYNIAVVMPETDGSSFYTDMVHGYPYFTYLTEEIPAAVTGMFPILRNVTRRFVAGFSMGGYGAYKWAFAKPDYFEAAGNFSGVSFIMDIMGDERHNAENKRRMIERNWGSLSELEGSPNDSKYWIDKAAAEGTKLPKLFAGMGTEDFSYPLCKKYLEYCSEKGIDIHYEEMAGGHEWSVWDEMIKRFLTFCM